jgi:GT2 family glycosyltransferase/glycosyltransferase involved in cell wall biosynthesis
MNLPRSRVSVVVITYRDAALLRDCLLSLQRSNADGIAFEVLVVVNGHQVQWAAGLPDLDGRVRYLTAGSNLGFAGACNLAARHSAGEYLLLLNDDALVEPGWLSTLLRTADRHPEAAAVGSCMLDVNGRIFEAGSVMWNDGTTLGVGRGLPASSARWDFVRSVDYCSAASLLVRRSAWDAVGGMDTGYHPAYAEDVDICLRFADLGMTVLFEPRSRVVHRVSQSSLPRYRDFLEERGRRRLIDRWRAELGRRVAAPTEATLDESVERAVDLARGLHRRVLVVDDRLPDRALGSGFGRMVDVLEELAAAGCALAFHATGEATGTRDSLRDIGCRVIDEPLAQHLARPGTRYDVAIVSRPVNVDRAVPLIREHQPHAHVVYDAEALWHRRIERQASLATDWATRQALEREAAAMRTMETGVVREADSVVCLSGDEADVVTAVTGHAPVSVIEPTPAAAVPTTAPFERRQDMVFVAGWLAGRGSPNEDALGWFVEAVLPVVLRAVPWARLLVTGAGPPLSVRVRRSAAVRLVGHVPELWGLYDGVRVAVSPTRFGSGVKIKTVEALAHGVPVVATQVGAEGVEMNGLPILEPTDDAEVMAAQIVELLSDGDAWRRRREVIDRWLSRRASGATGRRWGAIVESAATAGPRSPRSATTQATGIADRR